MNQKILDHYREYSQYTYPGLYEDYLKTLPDNVRDFGPIVRNQIIHRTSLSDGSTVKDPDMIYVDMKICPGGDRRKMITLIPPLQLLLNY